MKLLENLNKPADNCIILTYNLDLLFFEYMLYPSLYASGCRNTMILCDPAQYELALQYDIIHLHHVGRQYLLLPARTSPRGAFHPKLIFLTSVNSGALCLLSGNLTKAGYLRNWEVLTLFEYNAKKPDPIAWQACRWAFDLLSQIVKLSDIGALGRERLEQLWGTTLWLHHEPHGVTTAPVWPLHNLSEPLLAQLTAHYQARDGAPVEEVIAVSPFFDTAAGAIEQIVATLQPGRMQLYTQGNHHGLDPARLKLLQERYQIEFQINNLDLGNRRLHAKTLLFRTQQGVWLASGSANLSRQAWLHPALKGNTEIVVLRFEPDPTYFDAWLEKLTVNASPITLADLEPPVSNPLSSQPAYDLTLLAATLGQEHLELHLAGNLAEEATLTIRLIGEETWQKVYDRWQQIDTDVISLKLDRELLLKLDRPVLVCVEARIGGQYLISNPVLLHNLAVLERSKRPVDRRERPRIPEGMQPDSYAHCAALLDMLHDLLATNREQLNHHRRIIPGIVKRVEQEKKQAIEEGEYKAEDHFVEEQIRRSRSQAGADLYVDYYDRLTYEELLRAVLAAVYHPAPDVAPLSMTNDHSAVTSVSLPSEVISLDDETLKAKMLDRIEYGFDRLVDNFLQGTEDEKYLSEVPPRYLVELFIIITGYLRIVWRDGMLKQELFIDHSIDLMNYFWGEPAQSGAWQMLRPRLMAEDLQLYEEQLLLSAQVWLHTYIVTYHLKQAKDASIYNCAAWVRHLEKELNPAAVLASLPDQSYQRLWRFSQPTSAKLIPASEVVAHLNDLGQMYNDETLKAEILTWPNAKASIRIGSIGGLSQVPMLRVKLPLGDINLDLFWQTFLLFVQWPYPKQRAWARFENANSPENDDGIETVVIFYRNDDRTLIYDVVRKQGIPHLSLTLENIGVQDLQYIDSFAELQIFAGSS